MEVAGWRAAQREQEALQGIFVTLGEVRAGVESHPAQAVEAPARAVLPSSIDRATP